MDAATISQSLGMPELMAADERADLGYLERIQAGIPIEVLDLFIDVGILTKEDAVSCIGSDRTIARRRTEGKLSSTESDKFLRLVRTVVLAVDVFGNSEKAQKWFYMPNKALNNRPPYELLDTDIGTRLVEKVLDRITYGVYG